MSELATIKTALHELFHAIAHCPTADGTPGKTPREVKEIQAESGAYMVAAMLGLSTSAYSFEYIAGWNAYKNDIKELTTSMTVIRDVSNQIYDKIMDHIKKTNSAL